MQDAFPNAFAPLVEPAATRCVRVGQNESRQGRSQGQRNDRRQDQRDRDGDAEFAEQAADDPAHEQDRDEHRDQRNGDRHDCKADLAGALQCRGQPVIALLEIAKDVLQHDDRIVDDEPDREGQRHQRQIVETVAADIEHGKSADERQRHGQARDHGSPKAAQEDNEHDRKAERALHIGETGADR